MKLALYPVGSLYTNASVATNPATLLGFGTWSAFGAGRVMLGDGGGYAAGATGGSADAINVSHTHTATVTDPGHVHASLYDTDNAAGGSGGARTVYQSGAQSSISTDSSTTGITVANSTEGASGTNANLQPYIVVYMWQRIS